MDRVLRSKKTISPASVAATARSPEQEQVMKLDPAMAGQDLASSIASRDPGRG